MVTTGFSKRPQLYAFSRKYCHQWCYTGVSNWITGQGSHITAMTIMAQMNIEALFIKPLNVAKYFFVRVAPQKLLLDIYSWWHDIQISAMLASVSSISRIPTLGRPPSWCTLKFTACVEEAHSTAHTHTRGETQTSPRLPSSNGSCPLTD
jgi:hypothetical protein